MHLRAFRICLTLALITVLQSSTSAQLDVQEPSFQPKRFYPLAATGGSLVVGSLSGLYVLWYSDYEQQKFHFFNDNAEWLQMDKVGHSISTYYISSLSYHSLKWSGVEEKKALITSGAIGVGYLTAVEVMDGFSAGWGFSTGDMMANVGGSALFIAQQGIWKEQRLKLKYNFLPTEYPDYRPNVLGSSFIEQSLKDYNGQAYWITTNPAKWNMSDRWPKWFDLAFGYSADGMTGGFENVFPSIPEGEPTPDFQRTRQFYLSLDIDLNELPAQRSWFRAFRRVIGFVKIPAPAIGVNSNGELLLGIR
ncbi:MAG: YfiM family protein [Flavobacteriales bacterium]|nr:YfiM family protein [Flavobacteriales bacterium]